MSAELASNDLAISRMGGELLRALVDEIKHLPAQWQKLSESQQEMAISRLRQTVRTETEKAVNMVSKGAHEAAHVEIESLAVKKGAKCVLSLNGDSAHDVLDWVGKKAVLIMCDPQQYFSAGDEVRPDRDQQQLPLGGDGTQAAAAASTPTLVTADVQVGDEVRFLNASPDGLVRKVRVVNRDVDPPTIEVTGMPDAFAIALFELVVTDPIAEVENEDDEHPDPDAQNDANDDEDLDDDQDDDADDDLEDEDDQ